MTVAGPRQNTPRLRPPSPREGVRRRGASTPVNAVVASGATAWFAAADGSGLQQIPSRIGAGVVTLGSTTGVDANDPTYAAGPPAKWTFDATDDYMGTSGSGMTPTFDFNAGAYTFIGMFTAPGAGGLVLWGSGNVSTRYAMLRTFSTTGFRFEASGATTTNSGISRGLSLGGTLVIAGFVANNGIVSTYNYNLTTDTSALTQSNDMTGVGTFSAFHTPPRYGTFPYTVSGSTNNEYRTMVEWNGVAKTQAELDVVSAYLKTLFT